MLANLNKPPSAKEVLISTKDMFIFLDIYFLVSLFLSYKWIHSAA